MSRLRHVIDIDDLITVAEAAELAMVTPGTVRLWVRRQKLRAEGMDEKGRLLFLARRVLEVEAATRRSERGRPRLA